MSRTVNCAMLSRYPINGFCMMGPTSWMGSYPSHPNEKDATGWCM